MRRVIFKRWGGAQSKDKQTKGLFHQWSNAYKEFESGPGNYTVALIELSDGTIEEVLPIHLTFIDKQEL